MKRDLTEEFCFFLGNLPTSESIDDLVMPVGHENSRKADYFLNNRSVILEVKSLKTDPSHKVEETLDDHREREDFPIVFGEVDINDVLKHLPDGEVIGAKIIEKVTRSVEGGFRSADKQIRSTREAFNQHNALGVLVYINESIDILDPKLMHSKIGGLMGRQSESGKYRYEHIQQVWIISETHYQQYNDDLKLVPQLCIEGPTCISKESNELLFEHIVETWSQHVGVNFVEVDLEETKDLNFMSFSSSEETDEEQITRQKLWRIQYRTDPYLKEMTDDQLGRHGAGLLKMLERNIVSGGDALPQDKYTEVMIGFAHFLEEGKARGFDMKKIPKE